MSKIIANSIQHTQNGAAVFTLPTSDGSSGQVLKTNASGVLSFASGGKILQVQQATKGDTTSFSTGSSTLADSYFDISGLSVTLTPSSGTKCFITYTVHSCGQSGYGHGLSLLRGNTSLYRGASSGNKQRLSNFVYCNNNNQIDVFQGEFLDTHGADGSTAVTYKLQMYVATPGWTVWLNRAGTSEADSRSWGRVISQITVTEVAA